MLKLCLLSLLFVSYTWADCLSCTKSNTGGLRTPAYNCVRAFRANALDFCRSQGCTGAALKAATDAYCAAKRSEVGCKDGEWEEFGSNNSPACSTEITMD